MNKLSSYCVIAFLSFGVLAIIWAGYSLGTSTYDFWKNGVEKQAKVISFDHVSGSAKGGNSYYYNLEIDGQTFTEKFRYKLKEKSSYSVLYLRDKQEAILGQSDDGLFKIYTAQIGSKFMALLTIAMFIFMPFGCYKMYSELLSKKDDLWRNEY
jgi:hypothetical protein